MHDDGKKSNSRGTLALAVSILLFIALGMPIIVWMIFLPNVKECQPHDLIELLTVLIFFPFTILALIVIITRIGRKNQTLNGIAGKITNLDISTPAWLKFINYVSLVVSVWTFTLLITCSNFEHYDLLTLGFNVSVALFISSSLYIMSRLYSKNDIDTIKTELYDLNKSFDSMDDKLKSLDSMGSTLIEMKNILTSIKEHLSKTK